MFKIEVGDSLKLKGSDEFYTVDRINGDAVSLSHERIVAGMDIYLEDLPLIFEEPK